jgi:hypothetical protein
VAVRELLGERRKAGVVTRTSGRSKETWTSAGVGSGAGVSPGKGAAQAPKKAEKKGKNKMKRIITGERKRPTPVRPKLFGVEEDFQGKGLRFLHPKKLQKISQGRSPGLGLNPGAFPSYPQDSGFRVHPRPLQWRVRIGFAPISRTP